MEPRYSALESLIKNPAIFALVRETIGYIRELHYDNPRRRVEASMELYKEILDDYLAELPGDFPLNQLRHEIVEAAR